MGSKQTPVESKSAIAETALVSHLGSSGLAQTWTKSKHMHQKWFAPDPTPGASSPRQPLHWAGHDRA